jgi:peptidyl-prolyl cis-trans isomerase C
MTKAEMALAASLLVLGAGCTQKPLANAQDTLGPGEVATVNGQRIPEALFRFYTMSALKKDPDKLTPDERKAVIDDLIGFELLAARATAAKVPEERTVAAQLELQRLQVLSRTMVLRYLDQHPATDAELQKVYDDNLPQLTAKQYKARHILVETEEAAKEVISELTKGKDFVELAKAHADGPTGPNGGDLGWFTAASMVKPVADAVEHMQVGTYSTEPVKSEFGFHVIFLEDTRTQDPPTLDKVRSQLQSVVDRGKAEEFIKSLRDSAKIDYTQ